MGTIGVGAVILVAVITVSLFLLMMIYASRPDDEEYDDENGTDTYS